MKDLHSESHLRLKNSSNNRSSRLPVVLILARRFENLLLCCHAPPALALMEPRSSPCQVNQLGYSMPQGYSYSQTEEIRCLRPLVPTPKLPVFCLCITLG